MRESVSILQLVKCYLMDRFNQTRVERQLTDLLARGVAAAPRRGTFAAGPVVGRGDPRRRRRAVPRRSGSVLLGDMSVAGLAAKIFAVGILVWAVGGWARVPRPHPPRRRGPRPRFAEFLNRRADTGQTIDAEFLQPMERKLETRRGEHAGTRQRPDVAGKCVAGRGEPAPASRSSSSDPEESHTLAYLLTRFLDPTGGEIRIDGKNTRWVTHESLRTQIAMVMQQNLIVQRHGGEQHRVRRHRVHAAAGHRGRQDGPRPPVRAAAALRVRVARSATAAWSLRPGEKLRVALAQGPLLRDPSVIVVEEPELPMDEDSRVAAGRRLRAAGRDADAGVLLPPAVGASARGQGSGPAPRPRRGGRQPRGPAAVQRPVPPPAVQGNHDPVRGVGGRPPGGLP